MTKKNQHILSILISWVIALIFGACSDDVLKFEERPKDEVHFRLRIPATERVTLATRAADYEISSLTALCFNGSNDDAVLVSAPKEIESWTGPDAETGELSFYMKLGDVASQSRSLTILFLANINSSSLSGLRVNTTTLKEVRETQIGLDESVGSYVSMTGKVSIADYFNTGEEDCEVVMYRNVPAIEVKMAADSSPLEFSVYGSPETLALTAGINANVTEATEASPAVKGEEVWVGNRCYVSPVKNNSHADPYSYSAQPFVVVKAPFQGKEYYYRLALAGKDDDGNDIAYDLLPNHRYEVSIASVIAPGYSTEAEAAAGAPSSYVDFMIYDRQPLIMNMASDGNRELGVTDKVEDLLGEECVKEFYVKCYPAPSSFSEITFSTSQDWIHVSSTPLEEETVEDYEGQEAKLYKIEVSLDRNPLRAKRTGAITVSWNGLTRDVTVIQDRNFVADLRSSITLDILEGDGSLYRRINDYWTFVKGDGTETDPGTVGATINAPILHGIKEEVNNGRQRSHGLHFPVRNGGRTYRYFVTPDFTSATGATYYKVSLRSGSSFADELSYNTGEIALGTAAEINFSCDGFENRDETDALFFTAYDSAGNITDNIAMDLYHSGIFDWSDYPSFRCNRTNNHRYEQAWYYYEVVTFTLGGEATCWLDRNVGATSAGFDSLDADGNSIFTAEEGFPFFNGDGSALGGMYHRIAVEGVNYEDPVLISEFGPAGYQIPNVAMFNELRDSHKFVTSRTYTSGYLSYYQAYYETSQGERIYFPKAGMLQNHVRVSEGRTGYYWTSTAATGFEKEEIGKWLSTFTLSGNSSSISRSRINNPETGMSARLISVDDNKMEYFQTFFKVKGVTHVFLYRDNGNAREWPVAWPGNAVANADIAYDRIINYVYESSRNVEYKVIFNFVDETGAITTMAASNPERGMNATGWDAQGTFIFDENHVLQ